MTNKSSELLAVKLYLVSKFPGKYKLHDLYKQPDTIVMQTKI